MGTRHLTCVVLDNKFRVAQYGQWDGYPSGQGKTVYNFLKNNDLKAFKKRVGELTELTDEEVEARWKECGATGRWATLDVANSFGVKYPHLSRDTGAEILDLIAKGATKEVHLATEFAADSLFCEWAWVIDLDNNKLEVYTGFQKTPNSDRFSYLFEEGKPAHRTDVYYPVALHTSFDLNDLPDYEVFLEMCDDSDDDD